MSGWPDSFSLIHPIPINAWLQKCSSKVQKISSESIKPMEKNVVNQNLTISVKRQVLLVGSRSRFLNVFIKNEEKNECQFFYFLTANKTWFLGDNLGSKTGRIQDLNPDLWRYRNRSKRSKCSITGAINSLNV